MLKKILKKSKKIGAKQEGEQVKKSFKTFSNRKNAETWAAET